MNQEDEKDISNGHMEAKHGKEKNEPTSYLFVVLFYFLGTTCFVPSNFYIIANGYWMYKFRDPDLPYNVSSSDIQKTDLQKNFTAYTSLASNLGMIVFLFITLIFARKVALEIRIIGSMIGLLLLFAITLFFVFFQTDSWQTGFFYIAVGIGGLLSSCASVLLVSLLQLVFRFPLRCLAAQIAGQSVCGIIAACVQVFTLAVLTSSNSTAGLYYAIAVLVIGGTMIAFIVVSNKSEYFQSKLIPLPIEEKISPKIDKAMIKQLLKKVWVLLTCLIVLMLTTHTLYPGLLTLIESSGKGTNIWSDTYFLPVCVFLIFHSVEFVGREMSNYVKKLKNIYLIFGTTAIRLALFPLLLFCNIQPRNNLPVAFHDDIYFIIFIILLAFTNGYVQNTIVIIVPDYCKPEERTILLLTIMLIMLLFAVVASLLSSAIVNSI